MIESRVSSVPVDLYPMFALEVGEFSGTIEEGKLEVGLATNITVIKPERWRTIFSNITLLGSCTYSIC